MFPCLGPFVSPSFSTLSPSISPLLFSPCLSLPVLPSHFLSIPASPLPFPVFFISLPPLSLISLLSLLRVLSYRFVSFPSLSLLVSFPLFSFLFSLSPILLFLSFFCFLSSAVLPSHLIPLLCPFSFLFFLFIPFTLLFPFLLFLTLPFLL